MTIFAGKMRMPVAKISKKAAKGLKMKSIPAKKKKLNATKAMDDSISETISFVIKGHLTPFKSTVLAKKTNVGKKNLKIISKNKVAINPIMKTRKIPLEEQQGDLSKPKTKSAKKPAKKFETGVKTKKAVKIVKAPARKSVKKNVLDVINSLVLPDSQKGDIGKSLQVNHAANKVKNEISEKPSKKNIKENKQLTKVKTETGETKKQIKSDVVKRRKSPSKPETVEKDKQIKERKSEVASKKIKKSEEAKMKNNILNSPQRCKNALIKQKPATAKVKQEVKDKPKKSRVSSIECKQVKKDVKIVTNKTPKNNSIKEEVVPVKRELPEKKLKPVLKKQAKRKIKSEDSSLSTDDTSSTSDEITLDVLRQHHSEERKIKSEPTLKRGEEVPVTSGKVAAKTGQGADVVKKNASQKPAAVKQKLGKKTPEKKTAGAKSKAVLIKKGVVTTGKNKAKRKEDQRSRKMKLFGFWNGPKRHRVASLNALAKVHCLYENETRGGLLDTDSTKSESNNQKKTEPKEEEVVSTRTLRSAPGLRGAGRHWDMHEEAFSSSEETESSVDSPESVPKIQKNEVEKKPEKKRPYTKRRRNRCELIMDLKDMVVRKRMASLNASAILAASYSVEKRTAKSPKSEETDSEDSEESFTCDSDNKKKCYEEDVKKEEDRKVIEVRATPNKKVSVILNQDTDVTITGVYVNSTTRSTHHEGYCSIAGMQYRISAKSHTQTASTTVATETIMQSAANIGQENITVESPGQPCKSYTPLSALSSMQPPGTPGQHGVPLGPPPHVSTQQMMPLSPPQHVPHSSPIGRRHGCASAFSAPPPGPYGPPPPAHHHPPPPPSDPGYMHVVHMQGCQQRYYQPAGPLINVPPHGHPQPSSLGKPAPLSEVSSSPTPPPSHQTHSQSSTADSLDSDVIITSATTAKEPLQPQQPPPSYRYTQYPAPHPGYSYGYPPQYYPAPPPAPSYHHELCYPPSPYLHHKAYPPPAYRRHLAAPAGTQYYQANPPDLYHPPPSAPNQQSQQVVTATPAVSSAYQPPPGGPPPPLMEGYPPPPPPTLVEPYPPPPHYYPGYGPAPPSCYTHSPPTRTLPYINAAYQSCPCPMQSCPKNVHTGPLTGDSKRSSHISSIAKDSLPLPPVALALPLEPVSATGPPSPARGSAGMPPPPSPAGATYQPPPPTPKQEGGESGDCKPIEKRRKARVGKSMVRNNIAANFPENTMLLMCHPPQHNMCVTNVKREIESPEEQKPCSNIALKSKVEAPEITPLRNSSSSEINKDSSDTKVQRDVVVTCLKTEDQVTPTKVKEADEKTSLEELLPCVKTVAENVKVKNMKRKLSITKDLDKAEAESPPPQKKQKVDKAKVNGSYKDLIKKHVPSIKINNGKRKLNIECDRLVISRAKMKLKKTPVKRKLSPSKEELNNKRLKTSKPLAASNLHNSKQNLKNNKGKCFVDFELSENKEPLIKTLKKSQVNSKTNLNGKKLAPAILDSLFAKNNVDRTIESVINRYADTLRTTKKLEASAKMAEKCKNVKIDNKQEPVNSKSTNSKTGQIKPKVIIAKKVGACKRKSKSKSIDVPLTVVARVPRRYLQLPKWSNGWTWKGDPFQAKIFLNSDETTVIRRCYPAMRHSEGDIIEPKDCVLLKAGPRRNDLPFVAKVAALWENPDDGEMMMSLLWYYRPEHTEQGRQAYDEPDEVFASRHKDTNSVACIEDKCYVLTFNEYCRYRKSLRRLEEGLEDATSCIPNPEPYPRLLRQPPAKVQTPSDLVFFCRRVYDFRQKRIVKNPS